MGIAEHLVRKHHRCPSKRYCWRMRKNDPPALHLATDHLSRVQPTAANENPTLHSPAVSKTGQSHPRARPTFSTRSQPSAVRSGANSISKHHRGTPIAGKSPSGCGKPGPMPSAMRPEKAKVELSERQARICASRRHPPPQLSDGISDDAPCGTTEDVDVSALDLYMPHDRA